MKIFNEKGVGLLVEFNSNKRFFGALFSPSFVFSGVGKACVSVFLEEVKA